MATINSNITSSGTYASLDAKYGPYVDLNDALDKLYFINFGQRVNYLTPGLKIGVYTDNSKQKVKEYKVEGDVNNPSENIFKEIDPLPSYDIVSDKGKVLGLDNQGNPTWVSQPDISGKADANNVYTKTDVDNALVNKINKVTGAAGKLPKLNSDGILESSGIDASAVITDISGKVDKVNGANNDNFVAFDDNGGIKDSGKKSSDFVQMPTDGSTGQSLKKTSNGVEWGSISYDDVTNKPTINNVALSQNKTASELGLATAEQGTKADNAIPMPSSGSDGQILEKDSNGVKWSPKPSNGLSAYELYVEKYKTAHSGDATGAMTEAEWLASLKAQFGSFVPALYCTDTGHEGEPGDSNNNLITPDATTLNYIYLVDNNSTTPTGKTMWITIIVDDSDPSNIIYGWTSIGDVQVDLKFETGQALNGVAIDGTQLANPTSNALAKAEDVMQLAAKLKDVTLKDVPAPTVTPTIGYVHKDTGEITSGSSTQSQSIEIPLGDAVSVRFRGAKVKSTGFSSGYAFGHYEEIEGEDTWVRDDGSGWESDTTMTNHTTKEYIERVPAGATHFRTTRKVVTNGVTILDTADTPFYCYLQYGKGLTDIIPKVADDLYTDDVTKALSARQGVILGQKTQDIIYGETRLDTNITDDDITDQSYLNPANEVVSNGNSTRQRLARIDVEGYKRVRFLAPATSSGRRYGSCYAFYTEDNTIIGSPIQYSHRYISNVTTHGTTYEELANVPENAKYMKTLCKDNLFEQEEFYCYGANINGLYDSVGVLYRNDTVRNIDLAGMLAAGDDNVKIDKAYHSVQGLSNVSNYSTYIVPIDRTYRYLEAYAYIPVGYYYLILKYENDARTVFIKNGSKQYVRKIIDLNMYPDATEVIYTTHNNTANSGNAYLRFSHIHPVWLKENYFADKLQEIDAIKDKVDYLETPGSVLGLNPDNEFRPKIEALRKGIRHDKVISSPSVVFGHISDCHGTGDETSTSADTWSRFVEFMRHWTNFIDDAVDTGDMVSSDWENGIDWRIGDDNVLTIIGNHDSSYGTNKTDGALWRTKTGRDCYDRYIKPHVANWNVTQPSTAESLGQCYYFKDYAKSGRNEDVDNSTTLTIRAIFIDVMGWGYSSDLTEQNTSIQANWFANTLNDALTHGYAVVVFCHFPPMRWKRLDCTYSSLVKSSKVSDAVPGWSSSLFNRYVEEAAKLVYQFQVAGGKFFGYVCGHYHYDCIGQVGGCWDFVNHDIGNIADAYDGNEHQSFDIINFDDERYPQMVFAISKGNVQLTDGQYDYKMVAKTRTNDNFQLIAFNAFNNVARLAKVGCNIDVDMRKKDVVAIDTRPIEPFNTTKTNYKAGNKVTYNGVIYKFINPVVNNNQTDWDASDKVRSSRVISEVTEY